MKRKLLFVFATLLALIIFQTTSFRLQSHILRPLTGGLANDPGQTNCAACHSTYGAPIHRNSQFLISIGPDSAIMANDSSILTGSNNFYTPNHPNWISFTLTGANTNAEPTDTPYYGFQFTALRDMAAPLDSMAGSFTLVDPNTATEVGPYNSIQFPPDNGTITYVSHYNPHSLHYIQTWYFIWNAPDSSTGPVTFYYTGNLGNGNISGDPNLDPNIADTIFYGSTTLYPGPSSTLGIANVAGNIHAVSIYPVPFSQQVNADLYFNTSSTVSISLISLEGQAIKELYNGAAPMGHFSRSFDIADIAAGVYFIRVTSGTDSKTVKVLKY